MKRSFVPLLSLHVYVLLNCLRIVTSDVSFLTGVCSSRSLAPVEMATGACDPGENFTLDGFLRSAGAKAGIVC